MQSNRQKHDIALQQLVQRLDSFQIRQLRSILEEEIQERHNFDLDIIGNLPIEIVSEIFSYLDPIAPFLYQQVCKSWYQRLSANFVLKRSLSNWYTPHDPPVAAEIQNPCMTDRERHYARLEVMQRFRTGQAASHCLLSKPASARRGVAMSPLGHWVSWSGHDQDQLHIFSTSTGRALTFQLPTREMMFLQCLTDEMVTISIRDPILFHVLDLRSTEECSFRLPWAYEAKSFARGIAAFIRQDSVVIWSLESRKMRTFNLGQSLDIVPHAVALLVSGTSPTVTILICDEGEGNRSPCLRLEKYTFEGELLDVKDYGHLGDSSDPMSDPTKHDWTDLSPEQLDISIREASFDDRYIITFSCHRLRYSDRPRYFTQEDLLDELVFVYDNVDMALNPLNSHLHLTARDEDCDVGLRWKDVDIAWHITGTTTSAVPPKRAKVGFETTINGRRSVRDIGPPSRRNHWAGGFDSKILSRQFQSNGRLLLTQKHDGVFLHSFDPFFKMSAIASSRALDDSSVSDDSDESSESGY